MQNHRFKKLSNLYAYFLTPTIVINFSLSRHIKFNSSLVKKH